MNLKKEIEEIYNEINKNNRNNIKEVGEKYQKLLKYLFYDDELSLIESKEYVSILYRMIFETRDIVDGKGEYKFAHMLIGELVKFGYSEYGYELKSITDSLANTAILNIIYYHAYAEESDAHNGNKPYGNTDKPYGSWKDIKYFCNYLKDEVLPDIGETDITQLSIFQYILNIVVKQLKEDREAIHTALIKNNANPSLLCKWLPREKSDKFGWLARHIALAYYPDFFKNNKITTNQSYRKAVRKCLTHYRQLVAEINQKINPPQINQCNQQWQDIDFNNVSKQTLNKQALAFEYVDKEGNSRGNDEDRIKCRENYQNYQNYQNYKNDRHIIENDNLEKEYFLWDEINVILSHNKYNWAAEEINSIWMLDDDETLYNNNDDKEEEDDKDVKEEEEDEEDVEDVKDVNKDVNKDVEEQNTDYLMVVNDIKEEKKNNGWFGWLGWQ